MSGNSSIEWTDKTWNPVTGCDRVSPGCDHCYAETIATRFAGSKAFPDGFKVTLHPDRLEDPLHWRKPARVFVNSMSDLFHPDLRLSFIAMVFDTMAKCPQHTFQILTKRPQRMAELMRTAVPGEGWPAANVWLGTSIENDRYVFRANHLRATPAKVRFLSLEPLLGPLPSLDLTGIDWVIVGGESGPGARPMHPSWARDIRDRCVAAGIPFFFKQWGEYRPGAWVTGKWFYLAVDGHRYEQDARQMWLYGQQTVRMNKVGKHAAGRELDGRTWDEYPEVPAAPLTHLNGRLEGGL